MNHTGRDRGMITAQTEFQVLRLETRTHGDYSFVSERSDGSVRRETVIKHHGGYFYCLADQYAHYKGDAAANGGFIDAAERRAS